MIEENESAFYSSPFASLKKNRKHCHMLLCMGTDFSAFICIDLNRRFAV